MTDPTTPLSRSEPLTCGEKQFYAELEALRRHTRQERAKLDRQTPGTTEWDVAALRVLDATSGQLDFEEHADSLLAQWARDRSMLVLGWIIAGNVVVAFVFAVLAGLRVASWWGWPAAVLMVVTAFWIGISEHLAKAGYGRGILAASLVTTAALCAALVMTGPLGWPWLLAPVTLVAVTTVLLGSRRGIAGGSRG